MRILRNSARPRNRIRRDLHVLSVAIRTTHARCHDRERRLPSQELRDRMGVGAPLVLAVAACENERVIADAIGELGYLERTTHPHKLPGRQDCRPTSRKVFDVLDMCDQWDRRDCSRLAPGSSGRNSSPTRLDLVEPPRRSAAGRSGSRCWQSFSRLAMPEAASLFIQRIPKQHSLFCRASRELNTRRTPHQNPAL
jgi:hypothetical protein